MYTFGFNYLIYNDSRQSLHSPRTISLCTYVPMYHVYIRHNVNNMRHLCASEK